MSTNNTVLSNGYINNTALSNGFITSIKEQQINFQMIYINTNIVHPPSAHILGFNENFTFMIINFQKKSNLYQYIYGTSHINHIIPVYLSKCYIALTVHVLYTSTPNPYFDVAAEPRECVLGPHSQIERVLVTLIVQGPQGLDLTLLHRKPCRYRG